MAKKKRRPVERYENLLDNDTGQDVAPIHNEGGQNEQEKEDD